MLSEYFNVVIFFVVGHLTFMIFVIWVFEVVIFMAGYLCMIHECFKFKLYLCSFLSGVIIVLIIRVRFEAMISC